MNENTRLHAPPHWRSIQELFVLQEDPSDCGRACGLARPTVLSVVLLTALTFFITILVVDDNVDIH